MDDRQFKPYRGTLDKVLDFIAETRWVWASAIAITGILMVSGVIEIPDFEISGTAQVLLVSGIISGVVFVIPAKKIVEYFYQPDYELLFVMNAEKDDMVSIWSVGVEKMNEIDVEPSNKTLHTVRSTKGNVNKSYARDFDPEELTARVNWNGMSEELEMMRTQQKIKNVRVERRKILQQAFYVFSNLDSIVERISSTFYRNESMNISELTGKIEKDMKEAIQDEMMLDTSEDATAQDILDNVNAEDVKDSENDGGDS